MVTESPKIEILDIIGDSFELPKEGWPIREQFQFLTDQCLPGTLGMNLISISKEESVAQIKAQQHNIGLHGLMHGGTIFSVGDTVTALMACLYADKNTKNTLTTNASIRYLRPVPLDEIIQSVSKVAKIDGQHIYFVTNYFNNKNKRVAQSKYVYLLVQ